MIKVENIEESTVEINLKPGAKILLGKGGTHWRVLSVDYEKLTMMVIADREICRKKYHAKHEKITWEECTLRKWLNGEYFDNTFTEEEQEAIVLTKINNPDNATYRTKGGNDTEDKVFLLSVEEAKKYFKDKGDRLIENSWWLRSPGYDSRHAASVYYDGDVNEYGYYVYDDGHAVRPALILNLQSSLFESKIRIDKEEIKYRVPKLYISNGVLLGAYDSFEEIIIPDRVNEIASKCFMNDKKLKKVHIPYFVKKIGEYAFYGCEKLKSIELQINPELRLGNRSLGETLPQNLKNQFYEVVIHMSTEEVCDNILTKNNWSKFSPAQQAYIFMSFHTKNTCEKYSHIINATNSKGLDEELLVLINENSSATECKKIVYFITEFTDLIRPENAASFYNILSSNKKAKDILSKVEECKAFMMLAGESGKYESSLSEEEKLFSDVICELKLTQKDIEARLNDYFGLKLRNLPDLYYKNSEQADSIVLAFLLVAHGYYETVHSYRSNGLTTLKYDLYSTPGIMPLVDSVINTLDRNSFNKALMTLVDEYLVKFTNSKKKYITHPICRYADDEMLGELVKIAPQWKSKNSGIDAPPLRQFRDAILYSKTHAALLFADKYHDLDAYAKIRRTTADKVRDCHLSDIGLDENGRKEYCIGKGKITAVLQMDMSFLIETEDGKTLKSIPKKDTNPELYQSLVKDYKNLQSTAKKIVKLRVEKLFEDFLSGRKRKESDWEKAYLKNPLLRAVAEHIVWQQGESTFIVSGKETVTYDDKIYKLKKSQDICVAHPMEMKSEDILGWQKYFVDKKLSQPFEQVWEIAYKQNEILPDRYEGCLVFWRRFQNAEKHGISLSEYDYGYYEVELTDCKIEAMLLGQERHWVADNAEYCLGKFKIEKFSRNANHIIYLLDKWTIWDRIRKDDIKVLDMLANYNVSQINDFINVASENKAIQLTPALINYKEEHFKDYDAFDDFVLEW